MDSAFIPTSSISSALAGNILDNASFAVIINEAIRHETNGSVIDFKYVYVNKEAIKITGLSHSDLQRTLLSIQPLLGERSLFDQYTELVERGGLPITREWHFNDRYYTVTVSRFGDGLMSSFVDITGQKQTELTLRQANSTLMALLNGAQAGIVSYRTVYNDEGRIVDFEFLSVNQIGARLMGRTEEQLIGQRMLTLFPANKEKGLFDRYVEILETGQPQQFETNYQADGLNTWFDVTVLPQQDGFILTFLDIGGRKRAEERAHELTNLLTTITRETQAGIALLEAVREHPGQMPSFRFAMANPTCARMLGREQTDIVGARFNTVFPPSERHELLVPLQTVLETGEPVHLTEVEYQSEEGRGWFDLRMVRYGDGVILSFNDFTAIKESQLALRRQAEQLQAILDASISSILAMTAIRNEAGEIIDFRMDKANLAVERSLFTRPEELEGRTLLEVFPGNVENGFFTLYARATDTGIPQQGTLHYTDVNGFDGWFDVSAVQQSQDKVVITFMNITESKRIERQLRESNLSLNQFAYVASHDLQEPLRKIQSFGDMLLAQYGPTIGDGADLLHRMQAAAGRMQTLIRDILMYSRLSNTGEISYQSIDLNRLIAEVMVDLEMTIQERDVTVETGPMPVVMGDPAQLRQVFQNLLSNAIKFTVPDRKPRISVSADRIGRQKLPARVNLSGKPGQQYWQISVADNGIGFNEENVERIFDAFARLHGRSSPYSGSGIGLAIVRRVMNNHRGAVTASSRLGAGATFTLFLPILD